MKTIYLAFFLIAISISSAQTLNGHTSFRSPGTLILTQSGSEVKIYTVEYKTKDGKTDIIEFAKGFFEGTGVTQVFNEIESCLTDSEQVLLDLGIGFQDLETKNPEKVKEGIEIIGQAVKIIPEAAKLCQAADKDINKIIKIIKTFSNPLSVIYHAEKSLLINGVQVFDEIMHAIVAYQNKDYEQLGYWIGKAMVTIFLKSGHKDTKSDTIDFVEGFLDGVGADHVFDEIEGCLVDSEKTLQDLGIGIEDLESGNPEDIRYGIKLIGKTVKTMIPEAAKLCKAADADVKKIIKLIRTFTNPLSIVFVAGKSLEIDWVDVLNETISAIAAYRNQDYKDLGYWIGRAMATIFMQSPLNLRDASADVQDFLEGFFEGKKNTGFEQIKEDPISLLYEAGKNLITKNEEVMDGVNNAIDAYKEEDFSQLGYWIGKAMDIILVGEDQDQEKKQEEFKKLDYIAS